MHISDFNVQYETTTVQIGVFTLFSNLKTFFFQSWTLFIHQIMMDIFFRPLEISETRFYFVYITFW